MQNSAYAKDGCRTKCTQDRADAGQNVHRTGRMQEKMYTGQGGCRTKCTQDRADAGPNVHRTGRIQDRMDTGQGGCSTRRMQDSRGACSSWRIGTE